MDDRENTYTDQWHSDLNNKHCQSVFFSISKNRTFNLDNILSEAEPNTHMGHSVHNNTEHFLWSQVGKWAIMGILLIYYHIGTPTYMLNDVSKHPRPLKIMLNHIFKNQCHKPRNKKNTFLVSKVG